MQLRMTFAMRLSIGSSAHLKRFLFFMTSASVILETLVSRIVSTNSMQFLRNGMQPKNLD